MRSSISCLIFFITYILLSTNTKAQNIRVVNLSNEARTDVVTTVLPYSPGTWLGETLSINNEVIQTKYLGPSWGNGPYARTVIVRFPVSLGPNETKDYSVVNNTGNYSYFGYSPYIVHGSRELLFGLMVGNSAIGFNSWELVEYGNLVSVWRSKLRVPGTPVWAEIRVEVLSKQDHMKFWLQYGVSDSTVSEVAHDIPQVDFIVRGPKVSMRHEGDKVLFTSLLGNSISLLKLENGSEWAEGESQAMAGVLLFNPNSSTAKAETHSQVLAASTSWENSGAFGPWGYVPNPPQGETNTTILNRALSDYAKHKNGNPWAHSILGLNPTPSNTGSQADFGIIKLTAEAQGHVERLRAVQRSVYRDMCRPGHWRTTNVNLLRVSSYPNYLPWQGQPNTRINSEMFGKARKITSNDGHEGWPGASWSTRDREHWSANYVTMYALLTGDPIALKECDRLAEAWLAECRYNLKTPTGKPVGFIAEKGASRDVGRTLKAGTLLWLVTGRDDLKQRIQDRVTRIHEQWTGRLTSPVRPIDTHPPHGGNLNGLYPFFMPWQEAIGVIGLDAVYQVFGNQTAKEIADHASMTLVNSGLWIENNKFVCGKAVRWKGGQALTPNEYATGRESYEPYNEWAIGGVIIQKRFAKERGDQTMIDRCDQIINQENTRTSNSYSRLWTIHEWKAIK